MHAKKWTWLISAALVIMMLTLTGCQSIQGLELAKAVQNDANVKSSESKGTLQLELVPGDTSKLSAEEKAALAALKDVKVELDIKTQDSQHLSADGKIIYSKGTIPFNVALEGTKISLSIEGALKPIVFDILGGANISFLSFLPKAIQEQFGNKVLEIKPALIGLILGNTPDPANLAITSVTDKINGESLSLRKAHVELSGTELASLLQKVLANVLDDEAGFKEVLSQLYDALAPLIQEQIDGGDKSVTLALLANKDWTLNFVYSPIHDYLAGLTDAIDPTNDMFSAKASLQADVYIDGDKQIRKQNIAINMPFSEPKNGASAIKISYVSESWNLNKPVTANTVNTSDAIALDLDATFKFKLLSNLEKQSTLYKMMKEDMQVSKKDMDIKTDGTGGASGEPQPFINSDGVTMVPVRFVSEQFGAKVDWNGGLQQVTVKDYLSGKTLLLTLNSINATVDGAPVPALVSPAALVNESTYVPLRFIAEQLGCVLKFNDETRVVTLHRD
jgi:hypothetical protein